MTLPGRRPVRTRRQRLLLRRLFTLHGGRLPLSRHLARSLPGHLVRRTRRRVLPRLPVRRRARRPRLLPPRPRRLRRIAVTVLLLRLRLRRLGRLPLRRVRGALRRRARPVRRGLRPRRRLRRRIAVP
ncbi:hypothetical protein, partial [Streptomyces albidoflavus]|uniref:hypothetical protein n=1 Tax=Streptomyces albidoflavus TaxID=1886 RepID=UPI00405639A6